MDKIELKKKVYLRISIQNNKPKKKYKIWLNFAINL